MQWLRFVRLARLGFHHTSLTNLVVRKPTPTNRQWERSRVIFFPNLPPATKPQNTAHRHLVCIFLHHPLFIMVSSHYSVGSLIWKTAYLLLLAAASSPSATLTLACSCMEPRSISNALKTVDAVFRGLVVRKLKDISNYESVYIVRVNRLFKGCDFAAGERVIVTTGTNSALCGINIKVNATYVFSGYGTELVRSISSQIKNTKIRRAVHVGLCDYNVIANQIVAADARTMRQYDNTACRPTCVTGVADCTSSTQYCDNGTCVPYPPTTPTCTIACTVAPCSTAPACGVANAKCYDDVCGGCQWVYVDATATRVCK